MALETALADVYEEMEKRYQDKGTTFQHQLAVKQRRYYLRKEATEEAYARRARSVFGKEEVLEEI
jgi:hypothetical protein